MEALHDEELSLQARLSALHLRRAELTRLLKEEEERSTLLEPNGTEQRQREWEVVSRFVQLRLRQLRLKHEEARVNHQLSLL